MWYGSILLGFYFLYAPLLPLLFINRRLYRKITDTLYSSWESFNVVRYSNKTLQHFLRFPKLLSELTTRIIWSQDCFDWRWNDSGRKCTLYSESFYKVIKRTSTFQRIPFMFAALCCVKISVAFCFLQFSHFKF